jgi:hypothetical protein
MKKNRICTIALSAAVFAVIFGTASLAKAADDKAPYPAMAPFDQYLMPDQNAEIALARSAAPESIARDAAVMVLGHHGYEKAVQGKNGFVCVVERGWTAGINDPNFWNPKLRGPICLNAAAARSYLPRTIKKTELVIAGRSKSEMFVAIMAALNKKELPDLEPGAMAYMLSKDSYLGDGNGHWHPHVMFFTNGKDIANWGANSTGSPVLAQENDEERMTTFYIPVGQWSDGTNDEAGH